MSTFDFGEAIGHLKAGEKVCRSGWNGKGMWLFLVTPQNDADNSGGLALPQGHGEAWDMDQRPVICMKDAQNMVVIGWLASQTDMLAEDWVVAVP